MSMFSDALSGGMTSVPVLSDSFFSDVCEN